MRLGVVYGMRLHFIPVLWHRNELIEKTGRRLFDAPQQQQQHFHKNLQHAIIM
jgi:hypothetical protein